MAKCNGKDRAQQEFHKTPHAQEFKRYKCRGETFYDATVFYRLVHKSQNKMIAVDIEPHWIYFGPEMGPIPATGFTMEFSTNMTIEYMVKLMDKGKDLHVMSNSLKPLELFGASSSSSSSASASSSGEEAETAVANAY